MRHEVNQVFFTDVKVPVENRVGEENKGWTYAKYLLEFERGGQAHGPRLRKAFRHLQTLAKSQMDAGEPLSLDPQWREKMAALEMELDAVEMNELMFYSSLKTGDAPGNMASIVKMRGTEVGQKITELAVEAVGWYGVPFTELRNYDSKRRPGRRRVRRRRGAALLQQPQDDDLWRLVRGASATCWPRRCWASSRTLTFRNQSCGKSPTYATDLLQQWDGPSGLRRQCLLFERHEQPNLRQSRLLQQRPGLHDLGQHALLELIWPAVLPVTPAVVASSPR